MNNILPAMNHTQKGPISKDTATIDTPPPPPPHSHLLSFDLYLHLLFGTFLGHVDVSEESASDPSTALLNQM